MSIAIVHNTLLDIFQKDTALNAEFASALTGTASSSTTTVTGVNTLFTTEVAVDDYIGTPTKGYRRVMSITSNLSLNVEAAFDSALATEAIKKTRIGKGFSDNDGTGSAGKILRILFNSSADLDHDMARELGLANSGAKVYAVYGFFIIVGFTEPNAINADTRKAAYDKMVRDVIDNHMDVNGLCVGITKMDRLLIFKRPNTNLYFGDMSLTVFKSETRGAR